MGNNQNVAHRSFTAGIYLASWTTDWFISYDVHRTNPSRINFYSHIYQEIAFCRIDKMNMFETTGGIGVDGYETLSAVDYSRLGRQLRTVLTAALERRKAAIDVFLGNPFIPLHTRVYTRLWNILLPFEGSNNFFLSLICYLLMVLLGMPIILLLELYEYIITGRCKWLEQCSPEELEWVEMTMNAHPQLDRRAIETAILRDLEGLVAEWSGRYPQMQFMCSRDENVRTSTRYGDGYYNHFKIIGTVVGDPVDPDAIYILK
jgi:hypothetical protein